MASKHSQSKFMRILTTPVRVLCKARDLYVRSMINCSNNYGHGGGLSSGQYMLPKSFSTTSSRSNDDDEDFRELMRAASARGFGHKNELEMYLQQIKQQSLLKAKEASSNGNLPKSVSVGMGFMGRIDEDKACDQFEEDPADFNPKKKSEVYPRSKSYAVANRNAAF